MWTIILLAAIIALFIYGWNHLEKSTMELIAFACGVLTCILLLVWGLDFGPAVALACVVGFVLLFVLDQQEEKSKTKQSTSSSTGTSGRGYAPSNTATPSRTSNYNTQTSSRSSSLAISMDNPQVAALADEVIKVCNDMFEAGMGMSLYSVPRYGYEGHVFFFVDCSSDNKSNVEIYMNNVGIPQSVSGPEASTPIGEHYNRFLQKYQQYYAPDSFQNRYIYRARTRVLLIGKYNADKLKSLLCAEIRCRCQLATEHGNGSFFTKNVPH